MEEIDPAVWPLLPLHFGKGYEVRGLTVQRAESFVSTARLLFEFLHEAIVPVDTSPEEVERGVRLEKWVRVPDGRVFFGWQYGTGSAGPSARTTDEWLAERGGAEWLAERRRITAKYGPNVSDIIFPGMPVPEEARPRHGGAPPEDSDGGGFDSGRTSDSRPAEPRQWAGHAAALSVAALVETMDAAPEGLRQWVDDSVDPDRYHRLGGP